MAKKKRFFSFAGKYQTIILFFIFIVLSFIFFSSTYLNQNFFWDDERFIFLNPEVLQAPHWYSFWIFKSEFFKSWPLGYSIFYVLIKYSTLNSLNFFKSLNIIFHAINAFLVYRIIKKFNFHYPILISLIFLIHPLNVEVVSWIFQLLTILAMTFFLLSFLNLIKFLKLKKLRYYIGSLLFFLFSLWTKSIALFSPCLFVLIFWLYRSKLKSYLLLTPFFLLSLYIGFFNIRGIKYTTGQGPNKDSTTSEIIISKLEKDLDLVIEKNKSIIKNTSEKIYFDFIYPKTETTFTYKPIKIFKQASWHYFSQLLIPMNMNFIYEDIDYGYVLTSIPIFILLIVPLFFIKKDRLYLFIPFMTLAFLFPYMGLSNITFFYWSNVSDRYLYFFILVLIFVLGLLAKKFPTKTMETLISFYCLLLSIQSIHYGLKFNRPVELYKEIIIYKPHPVIYSAIIDDYIIKLDEINGERILNEALKKYPNDPLLETEKFKLNNLKKFYLNNK